MCTSGRESTLRFRYLVASFGTYGYKPDVSQNSETEKVEIHKFSCLYRKNEQFVFEGDLYRLIGPERDKFCAYMQISKKLLSKF